IFLCYNPVFFFLAVYGFFFSSRRRHTRWPRDWSSDMCSSDLVMGVASLVFGIEHFLHPEFVPVVPLKQLMPSWIPGHSFLAYLTGAVLLGSSLCMLFRWKARIVAAWVGIFVFVIVMLVYLPIT